MISDKIIAGAISGFVSALIVDLHAWSESEGPFNWKKAFKRWVAGAVSGATAGTIFGASIGA